ncbi:uncharacterized protein LOC133186612 [Saccostrea echinata]|uniref:uncharacterized protein LOC133186612 n=1 Tax=Saccostrea echinata TaxID=191078 RepID=UPI002A7F4E90|nr:uncharacterized protein LOC133186612 [Saccostrea echinata]
MNMNAINIQEILEQIIELEKRVVIMDDIYTILLERAYALEQMVEECMLKYKMEQSEVILQNFLLDTSSEYSKLLKDHIKTFFQFVHVKITNHFSPTPTIQDVWNQIQDPDYRTKFNEILRNFGFPEDQLSDVCLVLDVIQGDELCDTSSIKTTLAPPTVPPNSLIDTVTLSDLLIHLDLSDDLDLSFKDALQRIVTITSQNWVDAQ